MIKISVNKSTRQNAQNVLKAIALPPKKRATLLKRVARNIVAISKSNITKQQDPSGKKWPKRKKGRTKRKPKMLLGLRKQIVVSNRSNSNQAQIALKKGNYRIHAGAIGKAHSMGTIRRITANKRSIQTKEEKKGCTRAQAKLLKALDYKIYARRMNPGAPRGKRKVATVKFMVENFTAQEVKGAFGELRKAGLMPETKSSWNVKTPSRRFLGADKEKTAKAWARAFQGIKYGKRK